MYDMLHLNLLETMTRVSQAFKMTQEQSLELIFFEQDPQVILMKHEAMNGHKKTNFENNYANFSNDKDFVPIFQIMLELYPEFHIKDFLNKFTELVLDFNNQYRSLLSS